MSANGNGLIQKLWSYCNVLRLEREWEALPPLPPSATSIFGAFDGHRSRVAWLREGLARASS